MANEESSRRSNSPAAPAGPSADHDKREVSVSLSESDGSPLSSAPDHLSPPDWDMEYNVNTAPETTTTEPMEATDVNTEEQSETTIEPTMFEPMVTRSEAKRAAENSDSVAPEPKKQRTNAMAPTLVLREPPRHYNRYPDWNSTDLRTGKRILQRMRMWPGTQYRLGGERAAKAVAESYGITSQSPQTVVIHRTEKDWAYFFPSDAQAGLPLLQKVREFNAGWVRVNRDLRTGQPEVARLTGGLTTAEVDRLLEDLEKTDIDENAPDMISRLRAINPRPSNAANSGRGRTRIPRPESSRAGARNSRARRPTTGRSGAPRPDISANIDPEVRIANQAGFRFGDNNEMVPRPFSPLPQGFSDATQLPILHSIGSTYTFSQDMGTRVSPSIEPIIAYNDADQNHTSHGTELPESRVEGLYSPQSDLIMNMPTRTAEELDEWSRLAERYLDLPSEDDVEINEQQ